MRWQFFSEGCNLVTRHLSLLDRSMFWFTLAGAVRGTSKETLKIKNRPFLNGHRSESLPIRGRKITSSAVPESSDAPDSGEVDVSTPPPPLVDKLEPQELQPTVAKRRLIITAHGIRDYGGWQVRLQNLIQKQQPDTAFQFRHLNYGFFSFLQYVIPPLRFLKVRWCASQLEKLIIGKKWDRIDVVAHSFGTHLIAHSLRRLLKKESYKIHTVIFAGSVLRHNFPWEDLIDQTMDETTDKTVYRVVNECGRNDTVLLVNQLLVFLTGAAGRFGFAGTLSDKFCNRYYAFGHSGYFQAPVEDKKGDQDSFMADNWLPLLLRDEDLSLPEPPPTTPWRDAVDWIFRNLEPIKLSILVLPLLIIVWVILGQRNAALEARDQAEKNKNIALEQVRSASSSIETLTGFAESAGGRTRTERELLVEASGAYNRILAANTGEDPAFLFEKAWALDRLSQVSARLEEYGFRPTGQGAPAGIIDSAKDAEEKARTILDALVQKEPESWRYVNERGQNSMLKAVRLSQQKDYPGALDAIQSALKDFDAAVAREPAIALLQLHRAEASDRLVTVLYSIPGRERDTADAVKKAESAFKSLIAASGKQFGEDSLPTLDYRALAAAFQASEGNRCMETSAERATSLLREAFSEAYTLAEAYRNHSRYERGIQAIQMAANISKSLTEADPADADNANRYGKALNSLGDLLLSTSRDDAEQVKEAQGAFETARQVYERLVKDQKTQAEPQYRHLYAGVLHNLAEIATREGNSSEAIALYDSAIAVQSPLVAEHPDEMEFREFLRNHRLMKTVVLANLGQRLEATQEFERLITQSNSDFKKLEESGFGGIWPKKALVKSFAKITELSGIFEMSEVQIKACNSAVFLLEKIVNESSDEIERFNLAIGYSRLAKMHRKLGGESEAKRNYTSSVETLKRLVDKNPTHKDYVKALEDAQRQLQNPDE